MIESSVNIFPFWSQIASLDPTTCNIPIFCAWAKKNQWLWALLSLSMLQGRKERLNQCQSWQDYLAYWALNEKFFKSIKNKVLKVLSGSKVIIHGVMKNFKKFEVQDTIVFLNILFWNILKYHLSRPWEIFIV